MHTLTIMTTIKLSVLRLCTLQDRCAPIHGAAENGHNDVVKILINSKADFNAVTVVRN